MGEVIPLARRGAPRPETSTEELVREILRSGSPAAKEAFYRRHARMVFGMTHRLLGGTEVDDVVQDTFLTAFERLHQLKDPARASSWLGAICVGKVRRRIRRRRMLRRLGFGGTELEPEAMVSAEAGPEVRAELRAVFAAVGRLDEESRIALVLRRVEGLRIAEIAETMGLSERTVKRRIAAADALLARLLGRVPQAEGGAS
ncbi:MAG: RNA polymerase sigma factor [Sandaracinaceae bacterium]